MSNPITRADGSCFRMESTSCDPMKPADPVTNIVLFDDPFNYRALPASFFDIYIYLRITASILGCRPSPAFLCEHGNTSPFVLLFRPFGHQPVHKLCPLFHHIVISVLLCRCLGISSQSFSQLFIFRKHAHRVNQLFFTAY